jgi:anti-anti-sigma factor
MKIERLDADPRIVLLTVDEQLNDERLDTLILRLEDEAAKGASILVIDCDRLDWLSSRGIGNLLHFQKRLSPIGVTVRVAGLREDQVEVLQVTRVNTLIEVFDTLDQAIRGSTDPA